VREQTKPPVAEAAAAAVGVSPWLLSYQLATPLLR